MATMTSVTRLPQGRPLTRDDLDRMPDDGHRYELIDGVLVVTPAPTPLHQRAAFRLAQVLDAACPDDLEVFMAPFDVALADDTVMQPDLLVVRRVDTTSRGLRTASVLAVEVVSPSTRRFDLLLKPSRLAVAGCPSYWVVDPEVPRVIAWQLHGADYCQVADVSGETTFQATEPYEAQITPADLVSDHRRS